MCLCANSLVMTPCHGYTCHITRGYWRTLPSGILQSRVSRVGTYHVTKGVLSLRDCYPNHVKILEPRTHEAKQPTLHLLGMEMISTRVPPWDSDFSVRGELHRSPGQIEWTRYMGWGADIEETRNLRISFIILIQVLRNHPCFNIAARLTKFGFVGSKKLPTAEF